MNDPRCVAIVTHDLYPFGAQRVAVAIVESLQRDHSVVSEVVSLGGGDLAVRLRAIAPVHNLGPSWKQPTRSIEPVAHCLRARGYRHVILNTVIAGFAAPIFRALDFSIVGLVHEMPELIINEGLDGHLAAMVEKAHVVVYPHAFVREKIEVAFPGLPINAATECFPQGLIRRNQWRGRIASARADVRLELGLGPDSPLVLAVGTVDRRKGFDLFVECADLVNRSLTSPCHFAWIGRVDPGMKEWLAERYRSGSSTPGYLHLLGYLEDTGRYHAAADIFALTSREDPFPNVVLESMEAGVPVLAFANSGGGADLAARIAGRTVAAFSVAEFADAIVEMLADATGRRSLGVMLQRTIDERFTFPAYTARLLGLLASARRGQA